MKCFSLVSLLLLGVVWCEAFNFNSEFYDMTKGVLEEECQKVGATKSAKKITRIVDDWRHCIEDLPGTVLELTRNRESVEDLCLDVSEEMFDCFHDLFDILKVCSKPEGKYQAGFIYDGLEATVSYICANEGAVMRKLYKYTALECGKNNYINLIACFAKVYKPEVIKTKSEVCRDLGVVTSCVEDHLKEQCPNEPNLSKMAVGLFKAFSSPCNN